MTFVYWGSKDETGLSISINKNGSLISLMNNYTTYATKCMNENMGFKRHVVSALILVEDNHAL